MKPTLMFCSVGQQLPIDGKYADNHWRRTDRESREYKTVIVNYNYESGFVPEEYSYDYIINKRGYKWALSQEYLRENKDLLMSQYEYIGIWDDDVQTDIESLNYAINTAHAQNAKIWQLSVSKESESSWSILQNNPDLEYTFTNFAEIMCPVYHTSLIPSILEFWDIYGLKMGWGFDRVASMLFKSPAMVVHSREMYHPHRETPTYDKTEAWEEHRRCIEQAYPQYYKKLYNEDIVYEDRQFVYYEVKRNN